MAIKLVLSAEEIANKVFPGVPRGYDPLEVDKVLDKVIVDFEKVENNALITKAELKKMQEKIDALEKDNQQLRIDISKLKNQLGDIKGSKKVTVENIDLIRRINKLEKFLWANGFNPDTIK